MSYPKSKSGQVNPRSLELEWNTLQPANFVVITREIRGGTHHFFGRVESVEKLRNCHMLNFEVWECWGASLDGLEEDMSRIASIIDPEKRHRGNWPINARWKKGKGNTIRAWDPYVIPGPHPNRHMGRYGHSAFPSDRTAEKLVRLKEMDKLDEELKGRAASRAAYAASRKLMQDRRDSLTHALQLTGLEYESTKDDFKRAQRSLMLKWHPDKEVYFTQGGGSKAEFQKQSQKYMGALAYVRTSLFS